jgi:hypothetical protein
VLVPEGNGTTEGSETELTEDRLHNVRREDGPQESPEIRAHVDASSHPDDGPLEKEESETQDAEKPGVLPHPP